MSQPEEQDEILELHEIPAEDSVQHVPSTNCICEPEKCYISSDGSKEVWIHRCVVDQLQ